MDARAPVHLAAASDASTYASYLRDGGLTQHGRIGDGRRMGIRHAAAQRTSTPKGKEKGGKGVRAGSPMDREFGDKRRGRSRSRPESHGRCSDRRAAQSRRNHRDRRSHSRESGVTERMSDHSRGRGASAAQRAVRGRDASVTKEEREDSRNPERDPTTESAWALGGDLVIADEFVTVALYCLGASGTQKHVWSVGDPLRDLRGHNPRLLP